MKGEISYNILFRPLPQVITDSGTLKTNSKWVLKIFERARQILKYDENLLKYISMIYLDGIGHPDYYEHNYTLQIIIHSELDNEKEAKKKISLVVTSNWDLETSTMNRKLFLRILQPDLDDLKQTSKSISKSYSEILVEKYKDLFEALAITYYDY